jgi:hypothetical protein
VGEPLSRARAWRPDLRGADRDAHHSWLGRWTRGTVMPRRAGRGAPDVVSGGASNPAPGPDLELRRRSSCAPAPTWGSTSTREALRSWCWRTDRVRRHGKSAQRHGASRRVPLGRSFELLGTLRDGPTAALGLALLVPRDPPPGGLRASRSSANGGLGVAGFRSRRR